MKYELDKQAMLDLVCGSHPNWLVLKLEPFSNWGSVIGGDWRWDREALYKYEITELYHIYWLTRITSRF